jgi:DivIVA domain-containing protein
MEPVDSVAALVANAQFRLALKGYNVKDVDEFLADIADRTEHGQVIPASEFDGVRFRLGLKGYNVDDVDSFLSNLAKRLATP